MAASDILHGLRHVVYEPPEESLRLWWRDGDFILRRHAMISMGSRLCHDIVLTTASDPTHELLAPALARMAFSFDRPGYDHVIAVLSHPNLRVRENAATVLLWDEPVAAEGPLLDATRDPELSVVIEAANTLRYYPTQTVLRCLDELRLHADEKVRAQAEESFDDLRGVFCIGSLHATDESPNTSAPGSPLCGTSSAFTDEELRPDRDRPYRPSETTRVQRSADEILALFADPDTSPLVLNALHDSDWAASLPRIAIDSVRCCSLTPMSWSASTPPGCFAMWQDVESLLSLLDDASFGIRKSAMYHLGTLPPDPAIAEAAWQYLSSARARSPRDGDAEHLHPPRAARRGRTSARDHRGRSGADRRHARRCPG